MFKNILVLAPHTDDGEFGCGGAMSRWIEEGKKVFYVAFSSAEKSVPKGVPKNILKKEVKQATRALGILNEHCILFDYPVRDFPDYRQNILEDMIKLDKTLYPDLVLLPSTFDTHQDHQVISQEGFRAFKKKSMIGYEVPWNNLTFTTNMFVVLEEKHIVKKIGALRYYKSQSNRFYSSEECIHNLAKIRGLQINSTYAEAFEIIRWVLR